MDSASEPCRAAIQRRTARSRTLYSGSLSARAIDRLVNVSPERCACCQVRGSRQLLALRGQNLSPRRASMREICPSCWRATALLKTRSARQRCVIAGTASSRAAHRIARHDIQTTLLCASSNRHSLTFSSSAGNRAARLRPNHRGLRTTRLMLLSSRLGQRRRLTDRHESAALHGGLHAVIGGHICCCARASSTSAAPLHIRIGCRGQDKA